MSSIFVVFSVKQMIQSTHIVLTDFSSYALTGYCAMNYSSTRSQRSAKYCPIISISCSAAAI